MNRPRRGQAPSFISHGIGDILRADFTGYPS